jgi:nitroimidazol reductase NimA-like FMN-containing flavoprotein (pyridoxamine 5'-phosphate oxidase superfamily)
MTLDQQTELSPAETDRLLARNETAVLALARDDDPYAIPISYGYDPDERRVYLRLVSTPDSEKRAFLAGDPRTRLVVHETDGDTYRSVVLTGTLGEVPREDLTPEHVAQYGDARRPLFEIWGEAKPDLDIGLYVLDPDEVSGRCIRIDAEDGI